MDRVIDLMRSLRASRSAVVDRLVYVPPVILIAALMYLAAGGPPLFGRRPSRPPAAAAPTAATGVSPRGVSPGVSIPALETVAAAIPVLDDAPPPIPPVASQTTTSSSSPTSPEVPTLDRRLPQTLHDLAPAEAALVEALLQGALG